MKPEKRQRKKAEIFDNSNKWTTQEATILYNALQLCQPDDFKAIQQHLPHKSLKDIESYIARFQYSGRILSEHDTPGYVEKSPIEKWLEHAEKGLLSKVDYSQALVKVMSIAGYLEPHNDKSSRHDINYSSIYKYLVAILNREELPRLKAIEATTLLDIIQSLAEDIEHLDLEETKKLLEAKVNLYNKPYTAQQMPLMEMALRSFDVTFNPLDEQTQALIDSFWPPNNSDSDEEPDDNLNEPAEEQSGSTSSASHTGEVKDSDAVDLTVDSSAESSTQNESGECSYKENDLTLKMKNKKRNGRDVKGLCCPPRPRSRLQSLNPIGIPVKYLKPVYKKKLS